MTMVAAAAVGNGPRYAPHDPTLPHPWRALVDGNTGYLYYWNPDTNVTQYEKPLPQAPPPLPPGPPPSVTPAETQPQSQPQPQPQPQAQAQAQAQAQPQPHHHHHQQQQQQQQQHQQHHQQPQHPAGNSDVATNGVLMPSHHKLAAIPILRNQDQGMGGMHPSHMPVGVANGSAITAAPGPGHLNGSFKYGPNGPNYGVLPVKQTSGTHMASQPPCSGAVDAYRMEHEVSASGDNVPAPFMTFDQAGLPPEMLRELQSAGFTSPTPIQAQSWPIALQNRDIVAIAKTGSGKTLGYLMPAFIHLRRHHKNSQMGPTVLVLAPTRELATQIQDEAVKFGRSSRISCTCLYGGAPKPPQLRELERGADIVVATPGRLNDILEMKRVSLKQVSFLILDEADRMLDMGFEPQIRKIVNEIPRQRQTLMYTATWPKEVRKIAGDLLMNPVQVTIGDVNELSANKNITQYIEVVPPMEKQRRLEQILRGQEPGSKIIVFCSTKRMCDQIARSLGRFGAAAIHGDKSQGERDWVLAQFRSGKSPVLVATDVAARGLDIKDIRAVVNYDFPTGVEDYVHRIGRTGRAGATGLAYTFFSDQDGKYAPELIKVLEGANQKVPSELRDIAARAGSFMKGRGGRWDYGGRGGRDTGRGFGAGRGEPFNGGRVESYGGRGGWGSSGGRFDRNDRGGYGGRGRHERDARDRYDSSRVNFETDYHDRQDRGRHHDKYLGDKSRDSSRRSNDRDRGRSYSQSYSRSPSRSRGRNYSRSSSRSRSPSRSRSRSRSRSLDRYNDRFNTYRGGPPENIVGNSPWRAGPPATRRNESPDLSFSPRRGKSPHMLPISNRDVSPPGTRSPYCGGPSNEKGSAL